MGSYELYKNAQDPEAKDFIVRRICYENDLLKQIRLEQSTQRKGVPSLLIEMTRRTKPPNFTG